MRAKVILAQPATVITNAQTVYSVDLATADLTSVDVDVNITSYTGLTNATITLWRKGADNVYYNITPASPTNVFTANGSYSVTLAAQNSASQGFGLNLRLQIVTTGTGSLSYTASVVGK